MTKSKSFLIVAILLVFVSMFGAWSGASAYDAEVRYADAPLISTYANETINYTRKEIVEENYTDGKCPMYISNLTNACGAVAGAEIVAFYDKYYPELIPNWVSYYTASGKYRVQDATYVPALTSELYTLMRTNVDDVGVSRTDFLNGLTSYINGKGYQVSYQSVKSGNSLNYTQCKNAVDNNKVIALFVLPTTIYEIINSSNSDVITSSNIAGAHIMVVYGYTKINYYNASGLFRTDTYLRVSTGRADIQSAYYRIDSTTTDAAYIVNIQ